MTTQTSTSQRLNIPLQIESLALLGLTIGAYIYWHGAWWLALILFLVPDLGMLGYLINPQTGARVYNAVHLYILPVILFAIGYFMENDLIIQLALIWMIHIAADRTMGYGLKYATNFKDTHLQRV